MTLAGVDAAIDYLASDAKNLRPALSGHGSIDVRHTRDLGRVPVPVARAVQADDLVAAAAQLAHDRFEIAEYARVLADYQNVHAARG